MAIRFHCSCGKQMQAKDEFAGRKLQCPKCAKIVRIPARKPKDNPEGATSEAPPAVSDAEMSPEAAPLAAPVTATLRPAPRSAPPLAKPVAKVSMPAPPLAKPVTAAPVAAPPMARLVAVASPPATAALEESQSHSWQDSSLTQSATPWLPGDEARFQVGIKPMREGLVWWEKLVLLVLAVDGVAGAIVSVNLL